MEGLDAINSSLKRRGVKGRLVVVRDRLFLRGTFTDSSGCRKERKINLDIPAADPLEAESRTINLMAVINSTGCLPDLLPWQTPAPEKKEATEKKRISVDEAVERLKADFWQGKVKSSAAQQTLNRLLAETARLPQQATLTMDLLVAIGDQQQPGSRTRQEFLKVAKRLALLVGIEGTDRLDALRTPYEPGVREVPSDEEIVDFMGENDPTSIWVWATWALATYGCRPSETFSLVENGDGTARVLTSSAN